MQFSKMILLLCIFAFAYKAQAQKILLQIPGITSEEGEPVTAVEFVLENSIDLGSISGGGGAGKVRQKTFKFKKEAGVSTSSFFDSIVKGTVYDTVLFKYYDAADVLFYIIEFEKVLIAEMSWLSPECPSCIQLEHLVSIGFGKISTEDKINNIKKSWNFISNTTN